MSLPLSHTKARKRANRPAPLLPIGRRQPLKGERHPPLPPGQPGEHALVVAVQQLAQVGQPPVTVHAGQQLKGGDIQLGRLLQGRVHVSPLRQHRVGTLRPPQGLPQPMAQAGLPFRPQLIEQVGIGFQPAQAVPLGGAGQQPQGGVHHRLGEQILIRRHAPQGGQHGFHVHCHHLMADIIRHFRQKDNPSRQKTISACWDFRKTLPHGWTVGQKGGPRRWAGASSQGLYH